MTSTSPTPAAAPICCAASPAPQPTDALQRLAAYRARLKARGQIRQAEAVARCMDIVRQAAAGR